MPKAISKLLKSIFDILKSIFKVLKVEITRIPSVPFVSQVIIRGAEARFPVVLSNIEWVCADS